MFEFKPLELRDKDLINKYFSKSNYINAEKNFSNLFMWRKCYNYEFCEINHSLFIRGITKDNIRFYHFPYSDSYEKSVKILAQIVEWDTADKIIIKPILPEMKEYLEKFHLDFEVNEDRDSFDYIYSSEKLHSLKGKHLRSKRRWVKKFIDNYEYTYENITIENINLAKKFTLNIIKNTNNDSNELIAMTEMFDHFFDLDIQGCVIKVDDEIIGVSTGEPLGSDSVIIHCERCNTDYEGIYNFINFKFIEEEWKEYEYINREEDLGIEGLRYAKLSYQPINLLKKYICVLSF